VVGAQVGTRYAGRVLLVDDARRVLLLQGLDPGDPGAGTWWFTPGGGCEGGERTDEVVHPADLVDVLQRASVGA
jgi:8-oxo-dGTP pyrophosphatase MutT (NUDIX family)